MGLLLIRLVVGLAFVGHGAQKLFGWFGGYGLKKTASVMDSIGMKPGLLSAVAAGLIEFVGGAAFAAGLFTLAAAVLLSLTMVIAIVKVHGKNGFWITNNGYEFNLILIAVFIGVALIGAGEYSLDAILR
jgi:putative oxidoreductase